MILEKHADGTDLGFRKYDNNFKQKPPRAYRMGGFWNYIICRLFAYRSDRSAIRAWSPRTAFRLFYLQIHPGVIADADDAQERANCLCGSALAANNVAHVLGIHPKREQNPHLVNLAFYFYVVRVINQRFNQKIQEILIRCSAHDIQCSSSLFDLSQPTVKLR